MPGNDISAKQKWVFNLLVLYIIAALFWWGYLLLEKIEERRNSQLAHIELQFPDAIEKGRAIEHINSTYGRQRAMVIGEGLTFLTFILIGVFMTRRYFLKEIQLARRQKNFLLSITHELKSPLASTRLNLETIRMRDLNRDQLVKLAGNAQQDIDRLENLVQKLLLAARIDDMQQLIDKQDIDLYDIAIAVIEGQKNHPSNTSELVAELSHIHINGDPGLLQVAFQNLLDNAAKYSPAGSTILVRLEVVDSKAQFSVSDRAQTIQREEYGKIFDRFYRIGNEDTRTATGTGLGLFIVDKVVRLHDGKVSVRENAGGGNVFTIALPVS